MPGPTVLIADDNEIDIRLIQRIFNKTSPQTFVQTVPDGEQAIAYLNGDGHFSDRDRYPFPSLLILDMEMPKKSGEEVLEWLKGKPELEKMFVVILTGAARRTPPGKMFEQHGNVCIFNAHFLKPPTQNSIEGLVTMFETWFKRVTAQNPLQGF